MKVSGAVAAVCVCLLPCSWTSQAVASWTGEAELGVVVTSGNTETQTINAKGKVVNESNQWKHTGTLEALNTADDERTTAEKYVLSAKSDYKFSEYKYMFARINYEDDRFSGYDYQVSEALGYGQRVIHEPDLSLDLEGGPGARQSKLKDGDSDNEAILRLAANLVWKLSDSAEFSEDLSTEIGEEATITKSVTALKSQIAGSLAMKVSVTIKNTSDVPPDTEKTDSETALTLVYSF